MRLIFIVALLFELAICCKSKSTEKSSFNDETKQKSVTTSNTYVENGNFKCRFILADDMTFNFVSITENDILRLDYFTTNGYWNNFGDSIILSSRMDTINHQPALLTYDTIENNGYSKFSFWDIYEDSIAAWNVIYPDGKRMTNGTTDKGADVYQWEENMKKNKFLEFNFSGYPNFRYTPPDSNIYKIKIKLLPQYIPDYFKDTKLIRKNDSLVWNTNKGRRVFVLLK